MGWVKKFQMVVYISYKAYKIKPKLPCIGKYEEKCVQYILYQNRPSVIEERPHH
jgi:hypothetical protein